MTNTNTQQSAIIFALCAVISAVGSLVMILTPVFLVVAFFAVPIGMGAALAALQISGAARGPMTAQIGVAGVIAGTTAFSLITGAIGAALVFLIYLIAVSYIVYLRLK
jgi:hypothetical protein